MQQIQQPGSQTAWNEQFIAQLEFIKKTLRFPIKGRAMWTTLGFVAVIPGICIITYSALVLGSGQSMSLYWVLLALILPNILVFRRFFRTLKFRPVPALPATSENIRLLLHFLQSNHFAFHQHPQASEVFQIISRNISVSGEDREVMVFIADEGRILLNSHFTQSGTKITMGTSHVKEMAKDLSQFIAQQTELSS